MFLRLPFPVLSFVIKPTTYSFGPTHPKNISNFFLQISLWKFFICGWHEHSWAKIDCDITLLTAYSSQPPPHPINKNMEWTQCIFWNTLKNLKVILGIGEKFFFFFSLKTFKTIFPPWQLGFSLQFLVLEGQVLVNPIPGTRNWSKLSFQADFRNVFGLF